MAIVTENYYEDDGRIFKRTYSDAGFVIEQVETGFRYAEAIDPHDATWTYIETDDAVEFEDTNPEDPGPYLDYNAGDLIKAAKIIIGEEE